MLFLAKIENPRPGVFEDLLIRHDKEMETYYGTLHGRLGGWGVVPRHRDGGAGKRFRETVTAIAAAQPRKSGWAQMVERGELALWVTCGQNLSGLIRVEGEIFVLLHGRRHGVTHDFLTEAEKASCQKIIYETLAPSESPFVSGVVGVPQSLLQPLTEGEFLQEKFGG